MTRRSIASPSPRTHILGLTLGLLMLLGLSVPATCIGQEEAEFATEGTAPNDPFFERYFHTYNSDYQFYFMRNRMRLNQVLASVSVNQQASGVTDTEVKGFLPIYYGDKFSFLLPFYMYHFPLTQDQREGLPFGAINNTFWQAIFAYEFSPALTLSMITESHHIGHERSQMSLVGSDVAEFVVLKWKLSDQWTVAPASRVKIQWDSEREVLYQVLPAGHVIWSPTPSLSMMTGLPSLFALEWAGPANTDVAVHVTLGEGNINAMAVARTGLGRHLAVGARFLREGYQNVYVPKFELAQNQTTVDQISQYKNKVQLELEVYPSDNSMIQLKGGYGFDEGVTLSRSGDDITKLAGEDGFYGGLLFTTRYDMDRAN